MAAAEPEDRVPEPPQFYLLPPAEPVQQPGDAGKGAEVAELLGVDHRARRVHEAAREGLASSSGT
jgi:hypothetical protein